MVLNSLTDQVINELALLALDPILHVAVAADSWWRQEDPINIPAGGVVQKVWKGNVDEKAYLYPIGYSSFDAIPRNWPFDSSCQFPLDKWRSGPFTWPKKMEEANE